MFVAAFLGSGKGWRGIGAGITVVALAYANVNFWTRIWNHPPLRENFGMPFVLLQYVGLFLAMPSRAQNAAAIDTEEASGLLLWGVGVMGVVLCWQLGLFIVLGH